VRAGLVLLGVVAYAAFLAALTPASFIAARISAATQGGVLLEGAQGTIWRGEARARVFPRRGAPVDLDRIAWRFEPSRLFAGQLAYDVKLAASGLTGDLVAARTFSGWQARNLAVRGDAAGLAAFAPLLAALRPTGAISITSTRLDWNGESLAGEAIAEWRAAAVGWSEVRPIGSYRATLNGTQGPAKVAVTTLEGPLRITGQGTLTPPTGLAFNGEARAEAAQAVALEPLLGLIGTKRPDGAHVFEWRN
jgi:general secretion pathway protein N